MAVLPPCCSFPPCTTAYSHQTAHPFHVCRPPPETTPLTRYKYWPGLKINQQKSAYIMLNCTDLHNLASRPEQGITPRHRGQRTRHIYTSITFICSAEHMQSLCWLWLHEKHETTTTDVSGNSLPCTVDSVRTGIVHSKVYRYNTAEKNLDNIEPSYDILLFPPSTEIKIVKTKIKEITWIFYTAQRMNIKFQDISSMIHVHKQSL